jgi:tetratricopeptide (TPR) repeat protein
MHVFVLVLLLATSVAAWPQSSSPGTGNPAGGSSANSAQAKPPATDAQSSAASKPSSGNPGQTGTLNAAPLRSDNINVRALDDSPGESSSKDEQVDLSPPENDARAHPNSAEAMTDAGLSSEGGGVGEFHPWDPHKAAKDVEVGDFYFKLKNYVAAESRYREALHYKDNDAIATFRLAVCLEKMGRLDEALEEYESYIKILPYGPEAKDAKRAIDRLKNPAASAKRAK